MRGAMGSHGHELGDGPRGLVLVVARVDVEPARATRALLGLRVHALAIYDEAPGRIFVVVAARDHPIVHDMHILLDPELQSEPSIL